MNENKNAVVAREEIAPVSMIDSLRSPETVFFSSIVDDGKRETKVKIYNAVSGEGENISDHLDKVIEVENILAHPVKMLDDETGEVVDALRVVLVTPDNKVYSSVATGVLSSIQKIMGIMGSAPWTPALKIKPVEVKTRKGYKTITLTMV